MPSLPCVSSNLVLGHCGVLSLTHSVHAYVVLYLLDWNIQKEEEEKKEIT